MTQPALSYTYFNMEDPVVGGYTPDKIALRRAMIMGFNTEEMIRVWWQGQALVATQPIPPGVAGHSPGFVARAPYDPAAAKALLDKFGYVDRDKDGWRELPDGKPLTVVMASTPTGRDRERDELWKKNMTALGIRIDFMKQKWPDLLKMGRAGTAADVAGRLDQHVRRGRCVHAAPLRPEHRAVQLLALRAARVRRALPQDASACRTGRSATRSIAGWPRSSPPTIRGISASTGSRTRSCGRGCWGYKKHVNIEHAWKYLDLDLARRRPASDRRRAEPLRQRDSRQPPVAEWRVRRLPRRGVAA